MGVLDYLREYSTVKRYLDKLSKGSHKTFLYQLHYFVDWTQESSPKFGGMSPDALVAYQKEAGNGEKFDVLDALQDYIGSLEGRYSTKRLRYTYVRGFFKANRAALPSDDFTIRGEIPQVLGRLTVENIRDLVLSSKLPYRACLLAMFSGGMGLSEIIYWSNNGAADLKEALKRNRDYVRVDLPGRKKARNRRPFYTIIMGDALDQLRKWMAARPGDAETIFVNQYGDGFTKQALYMYWLRHMKALGIIEPGEDSSHRTGRNPHELRDCFRSQWEKSPAKGSVAEYAMGHQIDPLEYNKAFRDEAWVVKEFRKAVPMLNIMSSGRPFGQVDEDEIESLQKQVNYLTTELKKYTDVTPERLNSIVDAAVKAALEAERVKAALEAERKKG